MKCVIPNINFQFDSAYSNFNKRENSGPVTFHQKSWKPPRLPEKPAYYKKEIVTYNLSSKAGVIPRKIGV